MEASQENVQQLMANIQELVEKGVEVALPNLGAPASNQSMSFASAAQGSSIKPLPILRSSTLEPAHDSVQNPQNLALEGVRKIFKSQLNWEVDEERLQWFSGIKQPKRSLFYTKLKAAYKKSSEPAVRIFDRLRGFAEDYDEEK